MAANFQSSYSDFKSILKSWKSRQFQPVYLLEGEETYFIDRLTKYAEQHILSESESSFNRQLFYGKDAVVQDIAAACKRFPMMSDYQLIIIKEAQQAKKLDDLLPYLENPTPSTILVIAYRGKKMDKRSKLYKAFKTYTCFQSIGPRDYELPNWLDSYLTEENILIQPDAKQLLIEYIGTDLQRLVSEIEKIKVNLEENEPITSDLVQSHTGISKDYNIFELQDALATGQKQRVMQMAYNFGNNPSKNPFPAALASLYNFFTKVYAIHASRMRSADEVKAALGIPLFPAKKMWAASRKYKPQKLNQVFEALSEADCHFKGIGVRNSNELELWKSLVIKIMVD